VSVPTPAATLRAMAGVTWLRLRRGRAAWIAALLGALPLAYAVAVRSKSVIGSDTTFEIVLPLVAIVPAMLVGASVGDELEERTATYLWSRPIARWLVIAGKLCALAPVAVAVMIASWLATATLAHGAPPSALSCVAIAAGALAASLVTAGIATIAPRQAMALSIAYLITDLAIGWLPITAHHLALTYHVRALATGAGTVAPVVGLVVIGGLWTAIAAARIRRLEV
jgi:hypothetical protein